MVFHRWRRGRPVEDLDADGAKPSTRTAFVHVGLSGDTGGHDGVGEVANRVDVDDATAFLAGRLVEHRLATGRMVPAWAVLNKLAHAEAGELAELAAPVRSDGVPEPGTGEAREPVWCAAQRSLAAYLLEGRDPKEVARIQREVLVPLELWLIDRSETDTVSSRSAVEMASDVLAVFRRSPR